MKLRSVHICRVLTSDHSCHRIGATSWTPLQSKSSGPHVHQKAAGPFSRRALPSVPQETACACCRCALRRRCSRRAEEHRRCPVFPAPVSSEGLATWREGLFTGRLLVTVCASLELLSVSYEQVKQWTLEGICLLTLVTGPELECSYMRAIFSSDNRFVAAAQESVSGMAKVCLVLCISIRATTTTAQLPTGIPRMR